MTLCFAGEALDAPPRREIPLEATWRRFSPLAKRAGITRIADLTGLDTLGIPVFTAIRPLGKSLSTQQGKGTSPLAAKVSALMESLETWSAENIVRPTVRGSVRSLGKRCVDVTKLPRAKKRVDRFAGHAWVEGRDLRTDAPVLVPLEAVTLDMTFTRPPVFDRSSNGLASGNVLVEAIVHGLCEVLERDAEAAWRRAGSDRRIVLDSITDPTCTALIDQITAAGARVFVWDLEGLIPAIGCAIMEDPREPAWRTLGFYQGFGAHLVPEIAIMRALTEAAQTRLTYIAGGRDDFFAFDYARATDPELLGEIWDRLAGPCETPALFDDLPRVEAATLGRELEILVERAGQVLVVDLTHPALGVPVAKVIVPGRATDIEAMG
jgi:ribosomal protein S12 methylthiotransferase accessory factor